MRSATLDEVSKAHIGILYRDVVYTISVDPAIYDGNTFIKGLYIGRLNDFMIFEKPHKFNELFKLSKHELKKIVQSYDTFGEPYVDRN